MKVFISHAFTVEHIPWILKKFKMISVPNLEEDNQELKKITQALKNATSSDGLKLN